MQAELGMLVSMWGEIGIKICSILITSNGSRTEQAKAQGDDEQKHKEMMNGGRKKKGGGRTDFRLRGVEGVSTKMAFSRWSIVHRPQKSIHSRSS
jgi:hypothetical protein